MKIALTIIGILVVLVVATAVYTWRNPMAIFNAMNRRALKTAGFSRVEVKTPVGTEVTWETGNGPVLFLLHGAGDHAGTWSKVAPELKPYHVIAIDFAGHGQSEPSAGPIGMGTLLVGLESVVDQRGGNAPVIMVGNSMGAWLAMLYTQKHPDRVARLVLVDGGAITGERPDLALLPQTREDMRRFFDNITDPGSPQPPDFVLDDIVRQAKTGSMGRLMSTAQQWPAYLMDGKLGQFTTPVDLLWGESDRLMPLHYAHRLELELPAVRLTTIPRCGHVPQQECPKAFTAKLKDVLSQPAPTAASKEPPKAQAMAGKK